MEPKESELSHPRSVSCTSEQKGDSNSQPFAGLKTPWKEFYLAQTKRLARTAAEMGVPRDQIADVVQEVWLDAWKHRKGFQGEDVDQRMAAWLGTVVVHKSIDALRRGRRRQAGSLDGLSAEPMDYRGEAPAERTEAMERDESLASSLEELRKKSPLNYRLVCKHITEARALEDLAVETSLGIHAISCRISRTLKKLRGRLRE